MAVSKRDGTKVIIIVCILHVWCMTTFCFGLQVQRNKKVFIGGVPSDATVADIINHFKQFGEVYIKDVLVNVNTRTCTGKGCTVDV